MATKRDYYEVLGIERGATEKEIKKAFRAMAREIHPDVNADDPEAESKFKEVAEAYEVLLNPDTRATYDQYGHDGLKRGGFQDFSQFSFEDIIRTFFGNGIFGEDLFGMGRRGPARGADLATAVEISLSEAAAGVKREVELDTVVECEPCGGSGSAPGTERKTCANCGGAGQVRTVSRTPFGQFMSTGACRACGGQGSIVETPCEDCNGQGRVRAQKTIEVEIPAGIATGQSLRLTGRGGAGDQGAPSGDLFVEITVAEDEQLARDGDDLIHHLALTMFDAALGARVTIPTLEGDEELEIKPGVQPGEVVSLKARGMPLLRGRGRGDLRIIIDVLVPRNLTDEQRQLLSELSESVAEKQYGRQQGIFKKLRAAFH